MPVSESASSPATTSYTPVPEQEVNERRLQAFVIAVTKVVLANPNDLKIEKMFRVTGACSVYPTVSLQ